MALIVEDGTGLANAHSYQTLVDARASADLLGVTLPVDDTVAEVALRNGARYVDRYEKRFSGTRLVVTQALPFPRLKSYKCYGNNTIDIASDEIPKELKVAQMFAATEYGKGTDVMPVNDGKSIASNEVVGAVKRSYFDNGKTGKSIVITRSVDALSPLLCVGGGFTVRTKRV
jgi:hypothetical protein